MSIYAAAIFILVPIIVAAIAILTKAVATEKRVLRSRPIQLSLPEKDRDRDEELTHAR
jgi:hypothetical protein